MCRAPYVHERQLQRAPDAVELITKPLETIVKGVEGVEHVYSQTEDDRVLVTARFLVGTDPDDAIVRMLIVDVLEELEFKVLEADGSANAAAAAE